MSIFYENEPNLQNYWRAIILYGQNVASYKFALAKSLLDLKKRSNDLIKLDELAIPFSNHLCEHLKQNEKQITSESSKFLETLKQFNNNEIEQDKKNETTVRLGFNNVIDAFHIVNGKPVPMPFFIDERRNSKGIRITENFYNLIELQESENFFDEVESRWRLVETAWKLGISVRLQVQHDKDQDSLHVSTPIGRIDVTSSKPALNGYQKSKCFFCYDYISIIKKSKNLCHVDHFFPDTLKGKDFSASVDRIWNLVLSCANCNNGEGGKFKKLPKIELLERLNKRNEYFISSHHPLRETIMLQTGNTIEQRRNFLQKSYNEAKLILIHDWGPKIIKGVPTF